MQVSQEKTPKASSSGAEGIVTVAVVPLTALFDPNAPCGVV